MEGDIGLRWAHGRVAAGNACTGQLGSFPKSESCACACVRTLLSVRVCACERARASVRVRACACERVRASVRLCACEHASLRSCERVFACGMELTA